MSLRSHPEPTEEILRSDGEATELGASRVEYLAFDGPGSDGATPVVLFGGAFQAYRSFGREAERLGARWPVILLNLPGQGSNTQPSAGLDFDDFADLVRGFLDHHGIERIVALGLSYGSAIAHRFATRHPDRTDRLIVGGIAPRLQPSLRSILYAADWLGREGRREEWAWCCVFHLVNMEARDQTGFPDELLERFHRSLVRLPEEARERWWANSARLFTEELTDAPECPSLVFACRHDHFMPPFQAVEIARPCRDAEFGVLQHADHLAPLERGDDLLDLYEAFLDGGDIQGFPWLEYGESAMRTHRDRRVTLRAPVDGVPVSLRDVHGTEYRLSLRNLGVNGAGIGWEDDAQPPGGPEPFRVRLTDQGVETWAVLCPDSDGDRIRFLFADPVERADWSRVVRRLIGDPRAAEESTEEAGR